MGKAKARRKKNVSHSLSFREREIRYTISKNALEAKRTDSVDAVFHPSPIHSAQLPVYSSSSVRVGFHSLFPLSLSLRARKKKKNEGKCALTRTQTQARARARGKPNQISDEDEYVFLVRFTFISEKSERAHYSSSSSRSFASRNALPQSARARGAALLARIFCVRVFLFFCARARKCDTLKM